MVLFTSLALPSSSYPIPSCNSLKTVALLCSHGCFSIQDATIIIIIGEFFSIHISSFYFVHYMILTLTLSLINLYREGRLMFWPFHVFTLNRQSHWPHWIRTWVLNWLYCCLYWTRSQFLSAVFQHGVDVYGHPPETVHINVFPSWPVVQWGDNLLIQQPPSIQVHFRFAVDKT